MMAADVANQAAARHPHGGRTTGDTGAVAPVIRGLPHERAGAPSANTGAQSAKVLQ